MSRLWMTLVIESSTMALLGDLLPRIRAEPSTTAVLGESGICRGAHAKAQMIAAIKQVEAALKAEISSGTHSFVTVDTKRKLTMDALAEQVLATGVTGTVAGRSTRWLLA